MIFFREIILNELVVSTEEDCNKEKTTCTTKQKYTPEKIHVHEGWKVGYEYVGIIHPYGNDINSYASAIF